MKKIFSIITIISILVVLILSGNVYAESLDAISVNTDKTLVHPGEEVKVTVNFGTDLGAYTVNVAYDNAIFDYVSAEGGTANDTTDKVKVVFFDSTGGTEPRSSMSVTFKAKADITTSNPTEFQITAEGLSNPDASVTYDDIGTPITKNVTVEPQYVDYTLNLINTGDIIKGKENSMALSYSSPMGRYYEHARLIAEATTPEGANVQLLGTDSQGLEHNIIQNGWGDAQGYKIGGKDVMQVLNLKGIFSELGDYTITLKLIDRDNSDTVIAQNTFNFKAVEEPVAPTPTPEQPAPEVPEKVEETETPKVLPKTGTNIYIPIIIILVALVSSYIYFSKRK